jgi:hypothetical protein
MPGNLKIVVSICLLSTVFGGGWFKTKTTNKNPIKKSVSMLSKLPQVQLLSKFDSCSKYDSLNSSLQNVSLEKDFEAFSPEFKKQLPMMKNSLKFKDAEHVFDKFCNAFSGFTYASKVSNNALQFGEGGEKIDKNFFQNDFLPEFRVLFFDFRRILHSFKYYSRTFFLSKLELQNAVFKMEYKLEGEQKFPSSSPANTFNKKRWEETFVIEYGQEENVVDSTIPGPPPRGGKFKPLPLASYKKMLEKIKTEITSKIFLSRRTMPFFLKTAAAKLKAADNIAQISKK